LQLQRPSLVQEQQLKLNPRLLQAIRLLALPSQELAEQIRQELEENPALEIVRDASEVSLDLINERIDESSRDNESLYEAEYSDEAFGFGARQNDPMAVMEQTIATEESLQDHLISQLGLLPLSPEEYRLAERLIQNTDENGFHILPPREICPDCNQETLERVLSLLQRLDPPGTCTSDYRESLLVQAKMNQNAPPGAIEILSSHFKELQTRNHAAIRKALGLDERSLLRAIEFIRTLDPFPGRQFSKERPRYIVPDLAMWLEDGEIRIQLNDGTLPRLSINRLYEELAAKTPKGARNGHNEAEKFAREKVERARFFIDTIRRRNETLLKTAQAIAEAQRDFFIEGPRGLKPLMLKEIAEKIGVHEATVSRVVNGKFVQTDWGTFELRRFFSNAVNQESGENISKEAAKAQISQIIKELHAKGEKISDRIIMEILARQGINIARRTVAKYRSELGL